MVLVDQRGVASRLRSGQTDLAQLGMSAYSINQLTQEVQNLRALLQSRGIVIYFMLTCPVQGIVRLACIFFSRGQTCSRPSAAYEVQGALCRSRAHGRHTSL